MIVYLLENKELEHILPVIQHKKEDADSHRQSLLDSKKEHDKEGKKFSDFSDYKVTKYELKEVIDG